MTVAAVKGFMPVENGIGPHDLPWPWLASCPYKVVMYGPGVGTGVSKVEIEGAGKVGGGVTKHIGPTEGCVCGGIWGSSWYLFPGQLTPGIQYPVGSVYRKGELRT